MTAFDKELQRLKGLPDPDFREWVIMQMKKCDERFQATVDAVGVSSKQQAEAIAIHAKASEERHAALMDRLSVLIAVSDAGKKVVEVGSDSVEAGSRWSKLWLPIFAFAAALWAAFHGQWPKG